MALLVSRWRAARRNYGAHLRLTWLPAGGLKGVSAPPGRPSIECGTGSDLCIPLFFVYYYHHARRSAQPARHAHSPLYKAKARTSAGRRSWWRPHISIAARLGLGQSCPEGPQVSFADCVFKLGPSCSKVSPLTSQNIAKIKTKLEGFLAISVIINLSLQAQISSLKQYKTKHAYTGGDASHRGVVLLHSN